MFSSLFRCCTSFDKVWHEGLIYKFRIIHPYQHDLLEFYLGHRYFRIRQEDAYSELKEIKAEVAQENVLGLFLYFLFISDISGWNDIKITTFDAAAIMALGTTYKEAVSKVQKPLTKSMPGPRSGEYK